jgi:hypothetical protein
MRIASTLRMRPKLGLKADIETESADPETAQNFGSLSGEIFSKQSQSTILADPDEESLPEGLKLAYDMVKEHQHSLRLKRLNRFGRPFEDINIKLGSKFESVPRSSKSGYIESASTSNLSSIFSANWTASSRDSFGPESQRSSAQMGGHKFPIAAENPDTLE